MAINPTKSPKISICLPSRGRPERLRIMMNSALASAIDSTCVEFVVYCDLDDISMMGFIAAQTILIRGPRLGISEMTNICYRNATGDILMYAADDILFNNIGWEQIVINQYHKSAYFLIYGDDLGQSKKRIATHGFVSRKFADLNGFLLPPFFAADFCDTWLTSVARLAGCLFFDSKIVIEHLHPSWGKAETDSTYLERQLIDNYFGNWIKFKFLFLLRFKQSLKIRYQITRSKRFLYSSNP